MHRSTLLAGALGLALGAGPAAHAQQGLPAKPPAQPQPPQQQQPAQPQPQPTPAAGATVAGLGAREALQLHDDNALEVQAAQVAQQQGSAAEVKQLAVRLMQDHQRLDQELAELLRRKNVASGSPEQG